MCQGINSTTVDPMQTPRGARHHTALLGRMNAGKSSLLNLITGQQISIVSSQQGTTTDAVTKPYELLPFGPVTFVDTAGINDRSSLGQHRVKATEQVIYRADSALLVTDEHGLLSADKAMLEKLIELSVPTLVIFNKGDIAPPKPSDIDYCRHHQLGYAQVSATDPGQAKQVKQNIVSFLSEYEQPELSLTGDLYEKSAHIVCVTPIDSAAPKGRLILPQVQVLRDILDNDSMGTVVKETQLIQYLEHLAQPPALVITDAQAIKSVNSDLPDHIPLTTFSTVFARAKGELDAFIQGAQILDQLIDGDRILIAEACSHNVQEDDIGRVKLPAWIRKYSGRELTFDVVSGHDFPSQLSEYRLVIHCGACMFNRREMLYRIRQCHNQQLPITNYGLAISKLQGVLTRVCRPFNL
ncbi:[FeFe] hydrogenase H-cluster maturation GTPase HydF [Paraferrimonas haliotis]|uniref:[FeFe] hydrogenase H-cluster maturation GTPase HydF n=1 Tax=Paraferrimonas haliotis TaxID=2013866 RepID=A0AA37WWB6_9GAMM|nr:[FeFe] hydrogenase H-cluster maturation GTPase HydF [Paraferrimonas haliotis]GLS82219.1 [FeFe] hydrogenase H-cluster maturation GTPase HydF [Paraferrimonas haliotis]